MADFLLREGSSWELLPTCASTKVFYRGIYNDKPALLIQFENGLIEKKKFTMITKILLQHSIPVPKIIYDEDNEPFVITEFIDGKLLLSCPLDWFYLNKAVEASIRFSSITKEELSDYTPLTLGYERLKYEMDFFLLHFYHSFLNEEIKDTFIGALYNLAREIDMFPKCFAHRDYHSENIIVKGDDIFIVDYQDALFAPRCYDLSSLYVDGYTDYDDDFRDNLIKIGYEKLGAKNEEFILTATQRAIKALGTFGYQIIYRKKIKYLSSLYRTLGYLEQIMEYLDKDLKSLIGSIGEKVS